MSPIISVESLVKSYGDVKALNGLELEVPEGTVVGVLGPNGAGKTTLIRILSTLIRPDGGRALVGGYDVVRRPQEVRQVIGLSGQYAAVDEMLTGRENLELFGRLHHWPRREVRARVEDLLEYFDLTAAAGRRVQTYSGGMRRRLDLAASIVAKPRVIALDEPTTGLDPRSRRGLWMLIGDLVREGTTLLLTTQYLEEADRLADEIVVIDDGRAIAKGTANELKAGIGGERLEVTVRDPATIQAAMTVLADVGLAQPDLDENISMISVPVADGGQALTDATRELSSRGINLDDLALRRPTLDDVFLALTGHPHITDQPTDEVTR